MKEFGKYHPLTLMVYFIAVLLPAMFVWNPIIQAAAFTGGIAYCIMLQKSRETLKDLVFYIPLLFIVGITNPLFSRNGATILFHMGSNPITIESLVYGIAMAIMIISIMIWFKCYNRVMTSDKFLYLFGRLIPKLSLVLSMALRFISMFTKQMKKVSSTQKTMGLYSSSNYFDRVRSKMRVLSALITWSLENSMDTSTSMKARGYGLRNRSSFSLFRFTAKDGMLLGGTTILLGITLIGTAFGAADFAFYPTISKINVSIASLSTYLAYLVLTLLPLAVETKENLKWKYYISRI